MDKHQPNNSEKNNEDVSKDNDNENQELEEQEDQEPGVILELDRPVDQSTDEDDGAEEDELQIAVYRIPESHKVRIVKIVPLPHARSEIWSYFGFIADDTGEIQDRRKVICKVCATTLSYSGNTTNLFTHLKSMHPEANPRKMPPTNKTPWKGKRLKRGLLLNTSFEVSDGNSDSCNEKTTNEPDTKSESVNASDLSTSSSKITSKLPLVEAPPTQHTVDNNCEQTTNTCSADDITNAIVDIIVNDFRPVSIVEGKGFQSLLKLIVPSYEIPDSQYISMLAQKKYEKIRRDLKIID